MTKYAEEVREQYHEWLVKPRKAAEVLKERGEIEKAKEIFNEIEQIEQLINQVHGGQLDPETPSDKVHIHSDIIYKCAALEVNDKLRPIYAELDAKEREEKSLALVPTAKKRKIWQRLFARKNKGKEGKKQQGGMLSPQITDYIEECVKRFRMFICSSTFKEDALVKKYYDSFIKSEDEQYKKDFLDFLNGLEGEYQDRFLSTQECAKLIERGLSPEIISSYNRKVMELKKYQTFVPDKDESTIIKKAFLEAFYNREIEINEQLGPTQQTVSYNNITGYKNYSIHWTEIQGDKIINKTYGPGYVKFLDGVTSYVLGQDLTKYVKVKSGSLENIKIKSEQVTDGRFFQFANRVLYKSPKNGFIDKEMKEQMELLLGIAEDIRDLENSPYLQSKEKQEALISVMTDVIITGETPGDSIYQRKKALGLYFDIKDLYEGFKGELPEEYEKAKKQTAASYAQAITEIKQRLAELMQMKQDFYKKTPDELEKLYGTNTAIERID